MDSIPSTSTSCAPALRAVADLLDAHRDLPPPYINTSYSGRVDVNWFVEIDTDDPGKQKATAARIIRAVGGIWDKSAGDSGIFYFRQERDPFRFVVTVVREAVCERVVTGTREVVRDVPAQEAVAAHTVTEVVEDVDWVCQPLLSATEQTVSPARLLMTEPHDGHTTTEQCPGCPHESAVSA